MFNFLRNSIQSARQCFLNSEQCFDLIKKSRFRSCHTLKAVAKIQTLSEKLAAQNRSEEFNIFEAVCAHEEPFKAMRFTILNDIKTYDRNMPLVGARLTKLLEKHMPYLFYIRGLSIVATYEELAKNCGHNLTEEELFDVYILGWIFEIFELQSILVDDIVDDGEFRYDDNSWYYKNKKHPVATYDSYAMSTFCRVLLNKYFKDKFYYYDIERIMLQCIISCVWGQHSDVVIQNKKFFSMVKIYTPEVYVNLVPYKSAYNFSAPIDFGLYMNGIYDKEDGEKVHEVSRIAGCILQFWDDFLDRESDIPEGKCSCIIARALQDANDFQKKILLDNYGKKNEECVQTVLKVYEEMNVERKFYEEEQKMMQAVENGLQTVKNSTVRKIISSLIHAVHNYHS